MVMRDERGMALALTLIVMVAIASLTLAVLGMAALEPRLAANLSDGAQARFAAEAGIEWGVNLVAGTTNWDTLLAGAGASGNVLNNPDPMRIGALGSSRGTFTVRVRNDTCAAPACPTPLSSLADPALTGVAVDAAGTSTDDRNAVLILSSTGRQGTAVKNIVAVVKKPSFPPLDAALAFPGNDAETNFNGNSFEVNGNGMHMDGTADAGCSSVLGISVSSVLPTAHPGANEAVVQNSLTSSQKDNVTGKNQSGSGTSYGDNTIATEATLTPQKVSDYINQAKQNADIKLTSTQDNPVSFSNIGDSCSSDINSQTCWGTADNPKIVWVKGDPDPTSMFTALALSGTSIGYGILIVEDGDFKISGNFGWYGVVIVTGQWVGLGFMGGGWQYVYGSVIVNETATDPGYLEGLVSGNAKIRYSCDAINLASGARHLTRVSNWREAQ